MASAQTTYTADIIIYGATSGGIISAVQAVKEGKTVELVEPTTHIGGMTTGGLGWVDGGELTVPDAPNDIRFYRVEVW